MSFIFGDLQYLLVLDHLQFYLSTQHLSVTITVDNLRHTPFSCVALYKLLALCILIRQNKMHTTKRCLIC